MYDIFTGIRVKKICGLGGHHLSVVYWVRMGSEVISIQNGGGMLTSSIWRAHGVRTEVCVFFVYNVFPLVAFHFGRNFILNFGLRNSKGL